MTQPTGDATVYEAEDVTLGGGTDVGTSNEGFTGTGYADMSGAGSFIEWTNVNGGAEGGPCFLSFRYAQGGSSSRTCSVTVNGVVVGELSFSQTATWTDYQEDVIITTCAAGTNVVRLTSISFGPNIDSLTYQAGETSGGNIADYTSPGSVYVTVPSNWTGLVAVGTVGDFVNVDDGSTPLAPLNDAAVQESFKTTTFNPLGSPVLICGSIDEVASDPFNGDQGFDIVIPENEGFREKSIWELSSQRHTTWTHLALHAPDALRQRVAWSLSQIVAVGLPGSGMVFYEPTEQYTSFYDIFVRNAFGK